MRACASRLETLVLMAESISRSRHPQQTGARSSDRPAQPPARRLAQMTRSLRSWHGAGNHHDAGISCWSKRRHPDGKVIAEFKPTGLRRRFWTGFSPGPPAAERDHSAVPSRLRIQAGEGARHASDGRYTQAVKVVLNGPQDGLKPELKDTPSASWRARAALGKVADAEVDFSESAAIRAGDHRVPHQRPCERARTPCAVGTRARRDAQSALDLASIRSTARS